MKDISDIKTDNPWVNLIDAPPYVLDVDRDALLEHRVDPLMLALRTELPPIPWVGDIQQASVIFLSLNPGFGLEDLEVDRNTPEFHEQTMRNLVFQNEIPFYYFDPQFEHTPGYQWWYKILRVLIEEKGIDAVAAKCMSITYHGYRSPFYRNPPCILPSQEFSFDLVRHAMSQNKCIVFLRSKQLWFEAVPELRDYPYLEIKNYRRPYITKQNLLEGDFEKILNAM